MKEETFYKQLEENRIRRVPVRNIMNLHPRGTKHSLVLGIKPGEVGLVSAAEYEHHRGQLALVTVPEWDNTNFNDGDPIKKKKKPAKAEEEAA
jgi:hypothetical protein